ncbi:MAG: sodium:calcium antiporter [Synergistaceae bacterium]|nr:sodium:calcium antiporter [Synergistaceae bacterium]
MTLAYITALILGCAALIKGADLFVDGCVALATRYRVPPLVVGLTIAAFGTSAPELAVSVSAALDGSSEIALSNVVGSNIFNLLVVLGACALVRPLPVDVSVLRRDLPISAAAAALVLAVALWGSSLSALSGLAMAEEAGRLGRGVGAGLFLVFAAWTALVVLKALRTGDGAGPSSELVSPGRCAALIVGGLAVIVGGGKAVVWSARELALATGMTETLVGATIVAVGTSLPEMVTSLVALSKGQADMAVGNAVGSNAFNVLCILGIAAMVRPLSVNLASAWDLALLVAASALTFVFAWTRRRIDRWEGVVMLLSYALWGALAALR